ncbi:LCP family protein [Falsibacillus albus]|uniref:LytR family transcriptional regulator n=1 Tax=Falsibacillus albus TaxID=2478915 RepID=A0A3L7K472_9BACI|nr:LCP family protein [Falsibacillus albus]RLQ96811.1 LytR family transcriptional regulator [Falsibacillus albus]
MNKLTKRQLRRKKRRRRIFWFLIFPVLLLSFSAATYGAYLYKKTENAFNKAHEDIARKKSPLRETKVDPGKDNVSILFIGIDDSKTRHFGKGTRSDALILATLNKKDNSVKMVSIPRDSYVYVPKIQEKTKITHAHAYGGAQATIDTVENLFDIPVDYFVQMNFYAFMDVVDALGGIEADVPYTLHEKDSEDHHNAINLEPGKQLLDGEEALALARTRHKDSDIQRGERQQELMKALVKKAASAGAITKYDDVIQAIGDNMKTNMTFSEMKSFASYATKGHLSFEQSSLKGQDSYINGVYYYQLDENYLDNLKTELQDQLDLKKKEDNVAQK